MASLITHLVLTESVYAQYFQKYDQTAFYLGVCFPDIRYRAKISRSMTHFPITDIKEVLAEPNSFQAGVLFHSLTDNLRVKYLSQDPIYQAIPLEAAWDSALKLYEDELLYSKLTNLSQLLPIWDQIIPEETTWGIDHAIIEEWHRGNKQYYSNPPTNQTRADYGQVLLATPEFIEKVRQNIETLKQNPKLETLTFKLYQAFPNLFEQI